MKKLCMIGVMMLATFTAYAGTLENKSTGERLHFELNMNDKVVKVLSEDFSFPSQTIKLKEMKQNRDNTVKLLAANKLMDDEIYLDYAGTTQGAYIMSIIVPVYNLPRIGATVVDIAMLPVKLPIKLIQNSTRKGDFNSLIKAFNTDEVVSVSKTRYERIKEVLVLAKYLAD